MEGSMVDWTSGGEEEPEGETHTQTKGRKHGKTYQAGELNTKRETNSVTKNGNHIFSSGHQKLGPGRR